MAALHRESDTAPQMTYDSSSLSVSPLQQEADSLRHLQGQQTQSDSQPKGTQGIKGDFEQAVESIPQPVAGVAAITAGILARCPGWLGVSGKVVGAGIGLAYGADLDLRIGDSSKGSSTGALYSDAMTLGLLGFSFLGGSKISSAFGDRLGADAATSKPVGDLIAEDWKQVPSWAEGTRYPEIRQEFLDSIRSGAYSDAEQTQIRRALAVAEDGHMGQLRQVHIDNPGLQDPFIIHPLRTANILKNESGVTDANSISAALLHDVVEDSGGRYTSADIHSMFGSPVGKMVDAVTKPPKINGIKPDLTPYYDGLNSADVGTRNIKLADRLDNIRDTAMLPNPEFQVRKLQETLDHYLPMADNTSPFFANELRKSTGELSQLLAGRGN